ncbi:MAG: hypothetical protein RMK20_08705, partial [Verrucomicrobiales bacterium]|nr:hypothetical protein [Verrucomicrobiales bacterium]
MRPAFQVWLMCAALSLGIGGSGCGDRPKPLPATPTIDPERGHLLHAQPKLPTLKLWVGDQELIAEI